MDVQKAKTILASYEWDSIYAGLSVIKSVSQAQ